MASSKFVDQVDVLGDIVRSWTPENREDVEAKLLAELEVETMVVLHGSADRETGDDDDGVAALGRVLQQRSFPRVKTLGLVYCRLKQEQSVAEIATAIGAGNLPNLETLNFGSNSKIGDAGAKLLAEALGSAKLPGLHRLHLIDSGVGDEGLTALANALGTGNTPSLTRLHVGSENEVFHSSGASTLAQVFGSGHLPALEDLSLQGLVDEEGVVALLKALELGKVGEFKNLDMSNCKFGLEGAKALADVLQTPQFSTLRLLDLQGNPAIDDAAILALSAAFKSNNLSNLRCLGLKKVSMSGAGLLELASVLESGHLPGLMELFADGAENTPASAEALVRAYEKNTALVALITIDWPTTPEVTAEDWPSATLQGNADFFKRRNKDRQIAMSRQFRGTVDSEASEENAQDAKDVETLPEKKETSELKPWKRGLSFARRDVPVEIKVCS
ncbi:hypothetical protein MPTK1_3g19080 [Marchantia polymorpha subsp. ruderalis]|uniref:WPP domain-containing protein n=2 Tax=Marchantia polymorpha TaxID=3197 RepID=A0AAF6B2E6_MARPO|nr:hypothetical protein MARPO_0049s0124 [Marchantia polymorpha]BBN06180.1 hypothetical protein Mp_3g19080 [Marchantia polymorpha subsp. ruderalis]|eukprot:PTQ38857.1 hypothetical protein MARPO_0049s0124 [Marchantia polymorpha]